MDDKGTQPRLPTSRRTTVPPPGADASGTRRCRRRGGDAPRGGRSDGIGHAGRRTIERLSLTLATLVIGLCVTLAPAPASAGTGSLSDVIGITAAQLVDHLSSHESDAFYLGTPYQGFSALRPDVTPFYPNGAPGPAGETGMNCTGFAARAIMGAGGSIDAFSHGNRTGGNVTNLLNWTDWLWEHSSYATWYDSKESMLASGSLEKGDIIITDPRGTFDPSVTLDDKGDNHILVFWGDSSDQDLAWHSSSHADGVVAGTNPGNMISRIVPKTQGSKFWVIKLDHTGTIDLQKVSASPDITSDNASYSLEGAVYGIWFDEALASPTGHSLTTDAAGHAGPSGDLAPGTYFVRETTAPRGFALDETTYRVDVRAGACTRVNVTQVADACIANPIELVARKVDTELEGGVAQGSATLAGAQFTVNYYDALLDDAQIPTATPKRSWVISCDKDGLARLDGSHLVSGDALYERDGKAVVPLGTMTIRETKAPEGYFLEGQGPDSPEGYRAPLRVTRVTAADQTPSFEVDCHVVPTVKEAVWRGGLSVRKVDRETGGDVPLGSATLAGTRFEVVSANDALVVVHGSTYEEGDVVMTLLTDAKGRASTGPRDLPYGDYVVREVEAPDGYLLSPDWSQTVHIREDGDVVEAQDACDDQVKRGDISLNKVDGTTMARLALVAFRVTSTTTGESHVIVTDENGFASTESSWQAHEVSTNKNDAAVDDDGVVDESLLSPEAGVWFSGLAQDGGKPDNRLGALPYDTYRVEELRGSANEGMSLVSLQVVVSRDGRTIDLGTVDDNPGPTIWTELMERDSGTHEASPIGSVVLVDTVSYENLEPGRHYVVEGRLMDAETGEVLTSDEGPIKGSTELDCTTAAGTTEVVFTLDASELDGRRTVAFERLVLDPTAEEGDDLVGEGKVVAVHEDLTSERQTVSFTTPQAEPTPETPTPAASLPRTSDPLPPWVVPLGALGLFVVIAGMLISHRRSRKRGRKADIY